MAAAFSMDLRERVFQAWEGSGDADDVAATFGVSRAWVHRLAQRRRETQSLAPRRQTEPPGSFPDTPSSNIVAPSRFVAPFVGHGRFDAAAQPRAGSRWLGGGGHDP